MIEKQKEMEERKGNTKGDSEEDQDFQRSSDKSVWKQRIGFQNQMRKEVLGTN